MKKEDIITKNGVEYEIVKVINKDLVEGKKVDRPYEEELGNITFYLDISEKSVYNRDINSLPNIEKIAKDIADTIIYFAEELIDKGAKYQNLNSAIHAIKLDISNELMSKMKYQKGK